METTVSMDYFPFFFFILIGFKKFGVDILDFSGLSLSLHVSVHPLLFGASAFSISVIITEHAFFFPCL
jgi:hypothetical protein